MANPFFEFKQFTVFHDRCAMKVTTEGCLLGAWFARQSIQAENVLDIGGGTGLLSLMLAQQFVSKFYAIEIENNAFEQMKYNFKASPWNNRLEAIYGDITTFKSPRHFEFIISNPPFYENELKSSNGKRNMALHDAGLTLNKLMEVVVNLLANNGKFGILLPHAKADNCIRLAREKGLYLSSQLQVRQTPAHDIFRSILLFSRISQSEATIQQMEIRDALGGYSKDFSSLLQPYYLYL